MKNIYLIGCGGTGAWLAMCISKTIAQKEKEIQQCEQRKFTLIDGDKLETRNLDRQLFDLRDVGRHKAEALARKIKSAVFINKFFTYDLFDFIEDDSVIFVAVDNHTARRCALACGDEKNSEVIIAANEYLSSEAYYYRPEWKDTPLDPRIYYPIIASDTSNDPMSPCTGEAQIASPQLAIANMIGASLAMKLWYWWENVYPNVDEQWRCAAPVKHVATFTNTITAKMGDMLNAESNKVS